MRIALTGGGSAGHVYPAIEVLRVLQEQSEDLEACWLGSGEMEQGIAAAQGIPFKRISSGKLRRYFSLQNFTDIFRIAAGFFQSLRFLRSYRPEVLFSKGGFVSAPPALAAHLLGIPVVTHESDTEPGLATRIIARFADRVCIASDISKGFYADTVPLEVTGNPVRRELLEGDPVQARITYGIPEDLPVLLVLGGSQGALQINELIWQWAQEGIKDLFIIHQAGSATFEEFTAENYCTQRFISGELPHVLAAANMVVSRAGAGAVSEYSAAGIPMILIPKGTDGSRGDQIRNAEVLSSHGAACVLLGEDVNLERLQALVSELLSDAAAAEAMTLQASRLMQSDAAERIASLLMRYDN